MSKGNITSNIGQGEYNVELEDGTTMKVWCVDLSEGLSGAVGIIDINGEKKDGVNIRANLLEGNEGAASYDKSIDGIYRLDNNFQSNWGWFFDVCLKPAWQYYMPTYRVGEIASIDGDTCTVTLDNAKSVHSAWDNKQFDINKKKSLSGVNIKYMDCNGEAFEVNDRVVVRFVNQRWETPEVIGFESNPKDCACVANEFIVTNRSGENSTGTTVSLEYDLEQDEGEEWVVDETTHASSTFGVLDWRSADYVLTWNSIIYNGVPLNARYFWIVDTHIYFNESTPDMNIYFDGNILVSASTAKSGVLLGCTVVKDDTVDKTEWLVVAIGTAIKDDRTCTIEFFKMEFTPLSMGSSWTSLGSFTSKNPNDLNPYIDGDYSEFYTVDKEQRYPVDRCEYSCFNQGVYFSANGKKATCTIVYMEYIYTEDNLPEDEQEFVQNGAYYAPTTSSQVTFTIDDFVSSVSYEEGEINEIKDHQVIYQEDEVSKINSFNPYNLDEFGDNTKVSKFVDVASDYNGNSLVKAQFRTYLQAERVDGIPDCNVFANSQEYIDSFEGWQHNPSLSTSAVASLQLISYIKTRMVRELKIKDSIISIDNERVAFIYNDQQVPFEIQAAYIRHGDHNYIRFNYLDIRRGAAVYTEVRNNYETVLLEDEEKPPYYEVLVDENLHNLKGYRFAYLKVFKIQKNIKELIYTHYEVNPPEQQATEETFTNTYNRLVNWAYISNASCRCESRRLFITLYDKLGSMENFDGITFEEGVAFYQNEETFTWAFCGESNNYSNSSLYTDNNVYLPVNLYPFAFDMKSLSYERYGGRRFFINMYLSYYTETTGGNWICVNNPNAPSGEKNTDYLFISFVIITQNGSNEPLDMFQPVNYLSDLSGNDPTTIITAGGSERRFIVSII